MGGLRLKEYYREDGVHLDRTGTALKRLLEREAKEMWTMVTTGKGRDRMGRRDAGHHTATPRPTPTLMRQGVSV